MGALIRILPVVIVAIVLVWFFFQMKDKWADHKGRKDNTVGTKAEVIDLDPIRQSRGGGTKRP